MASATEREPLVVPTPPAEAGHGRPRLRVGSFNVHAGVNGWGVPYDPAPACRALDADVLVLQEVFVPSGEQGTAVRLGDELGYHVVERRMAPARLGRPMDRARRGWGPTVRAKGRRAAFFLERRRPPSQRSPAYDRWRDARSGALGIAVLSRLPVANGRQIDLGRHRGDRAHRWALAVDVAVGDRRVTVVGTHMSHLTQGSPRQLRRLARELRPRPEGGAGRPHAPVVLAGDMNCWGPLLKALLPGWRRAVRGRTWPAAHPHSQLDHILVSGPLRVAGSEVLPFGGSDHRPVVATLEVAAH